MQLKIVMQDEKKYEFLGCQFTTATMEILCRRCGATNYFKITPDGILKDKDPYRGEHFNCVNCDHAYYMEWTFKINLTDENWLSSAYKERNNI
jgi:hypothetical protein